MKYTFDKGMMTGMHWELPNIFRKQNQIILFSSLLYTKIHISNQKKYKWSTGIWRKIGTTDYKGNKKHNEASNTD